MGQSTQSSQLSINPRNRVVVIRAEYNEAITRALLTGCIHRLEELGLPAAHIVTLEVPGAYELPLAAKWSLQASLRPDAVIVLGAVIRGDTAHFDYVCDSVTQGCTRLQLDAGVPIVFGVLTCDTLAQAIARIGGAHGHKGIEAADTAAAMLALRHRVLGDQ